MNYQELEDLAQIAWLEHSVTEVYESHHWYELAREEFIQEYIDKYTEKV